jgi:hypothetical protein
LQRAGTELRTKLQRRVLAAFCCRLQLGRADLRLPLLKELPARSTHTDADVARVTINSAEIMQLRVTVQNWATTKGSDRNCRLQCVIQKFIAKMATPDTKPIARTIELQSNKFFGGT